MSDDLVAAARRHRGPPFMLVDGVLKETSHVLADALEAQAEEITRLRALCDRQSSTISLSQMRHGRILVGLERRNARQRRALAKLYQRRNDKNAEIAIALKWRDAINGYLTEAWNSPLRDDEAPLAALKRLIKLELTAMALDPEIHKAINAAITTARRDALRNLENLKHERD